MASLPGSLIRVVDCRFVPKHRSLAAWFILNIVFRSLEETGAPWKGPLLPARADIRPTSQMCQVRSFALAHRWSVEGADDACLGKLHPHLAREFLSQTALYELRAEAPANGLLD
jgi:hypothetical protein